MEHFLWRRDSDAFTLHCQRLEGRWAARVSECHRNWLSNLGRERLLVSAEAILADQWIWAWPTLARQKSAEGGLHGPELHGQMSWKCGSCPSSGSAGWTRCPRTSSFSVVQFPHLQTKGSTKRPLKPTPYDSKFQRLLYGPQKSFLTLLISTISFSLTSQSWRYCCTHCLRCYVGCSLDKRKYFLC